MSGEGYFAIYAVGVVVIWIAACFAVQDEPTTHGQDVLAPMGCIAGLLWPLVVAYFIIISPWIAVTLWQTRGER